MKKILILFAFFYIISCSNIQNITKETKVIDCPRVFFSSEKNIFIEGNNEDIDLDTIEYKASLNNYGFAGECTSGVNFNKFILEILIVTEPINPKTNNINLPIFVLVYDRENKLIDKHYFRIVDSLFFNNLSNKYDITEVIGNLNVITSLENEVGSMTVGFVTLN